VCENALSTEKRKRAAKLALNGNLHKALGILLLLLLFPKATAASSPPSARIAVIIGFTEEVDSQLITGLGGEVRYIYRYVVAIAAKVPQAVLSTLRELPSIAYVEPDGVAWALAEEKWGVRKIRAPEVWDAGYKGSGVDVAVLDTGIFYSHPDLASSYAGGYDFVNNDNDPLDDNGHGTHVAGIIASRKNGLGMVGVAPEASLYGVKVLNHRGRGLFSDIVAGVEWAIDGPDGHKGTLDDSEVISMSFGSPTGSTALHNILQVAYGLGIVLVAAAGNYGPFPNSITFPAKYPEVIAVGATDSMDRVALWSSRGQELDVAAPGVGISSTWINNEYKTLGGTSMAAPHVSGAVALMLSKSAALTPTEVRDLLLTTAKDICSAGFDAKSGYGRIDAFAAVSAPP